MKTIPFDVVAFDLDGTIADTSPDLAAALNHALERLGRPQVEPASVHRLVGHGARLLLHRGLATSGAADDTLIERGLPYFLEHYAANICHGTTCYPGLERVLDTLKAQSVRTAICTNKSERLTHLLLDALGWSARFDAVVGSDTLTVRKPDPAPLHEAIARAGGGRAVFVGDTITDADTARAAGVPFVAVSFGFCDGPVAELGADRVIDHYDELLEALRDLAAARAD